ncbi:hypothetical protein RCL_jg27039.t1 [Rhizophagus clarus]|uniref:Uncharacterized protein n=1 Tax=Rhizophagus clarus TaxID=94130 RepID=A0A8H3R5K4_9GLOM|nr:hypothetical protein RCL_jg27039.t1 [Rhizophagus clarus]
MVWRQVLHFGSRKNGGKLKTIDETMRREIKELNLRTRSGWNSEIGQHLANDDDSDYTKKRKADEEDDDQSFIKWFSEENADDSSSWEWEKTSEMIFIIKP